MPDIQIFDRAGKLLLTADNLPDDEGLRERFPILADAYEKATAADAALERAKDSVATCVVQVGNAEQYIKRRFPPRGEAGRIEDARATFRQNRM